MNENSRFIYKTLVEKEVHFVWNYYLDDELVSEPYENASLIVILNRLGQQGWQLVSHNQTDDSCILMKIV